MGFRFRLGRSWGDLITAVVVRADDRWTISSWIDARLESGGDVRTLDELVQAADTLVLYSYPPGPRRSTAELQYAIYPWSFKGNPLVMLDVLESLPRESYCVTKLGFATTDPFDPAKVAAPPGSGKGPAGTCDGRETAPPCGPGVVVGTYYPYTWAQDCGARAYFDGHMWEGTLRPTQQQPPSRGWMILTAPTAARWTGSNGTDGLTPAAGPATACPASGA